MFTAVSTLLAVVAHGAAQRVTPGAGVTVAVVVVVTVVGALLCRRRRSFESIAGGLVLTQVLGHVLLCLDHVSVVVPPATAHVHGGAAQGVVRAVLAQLVMDPTMALAHLLAAGVAAWWLSRGEAAVWAAAARWWAVVVLPHVPFAGVAGRRARRVPGVHLVTSRHDQVAGRRSRPRRGPPVRVTAVA